VTMRLTVMDVGPALRTKQRRQIPCPAVLRSAEILVRLGKCASLHPALPFIESAGGWVANFADPQGNGSVVILLNTQTADGTPGEIFTFGDGTIILVAGGGDSGMGCTFNHEKNDSSGLKGDVTCTSAIAVNNTTGAQLHVQVHAEWDAHP